MDEALRRLKPDPENWPEWVQAELRALAVCHAALPPAERARAVKGALSPQARAYFAEQARRALVAHRTLRGAHRAR